MSAAHPSLVWLVPLHDARPVCACLSHLLCRSSLSEADGHAAAPHGILMLFLHSWVVPPVGPSSTTGTMYAASLHHGRCCPLQPAACSVFKEKNEVQWSPVPLDALLDVDAIIDYWCDKMRRTTFCMCCLLAVWCQLMLRWMWRAALPIGALRSMPLCGADGGLLAVGGCPCTCS